MKAKYDVFISYSSEDLKVTEDICRFLELYGIKCFVNYRDLPCGVISDNAITYAISESRMIVLVFSEHFNNSRQTDIEFCQAADREKPIISFRLSDNQFTGAKRYYLMNVHFEYYKTNFINIDAFPDTAKRFDSLYIKICDMLGIPNKLTSLISASPIASRKDKEIFISYSRNDLSKVKLVKEEIDLALNTVSWMDLEGIESGDKFDNIIVDAIENCKIMLFMLTQNSMKSDYALKEIGYAQSLGKRIVIVKIKECELFGVFRFRYQYNDQIDWDIKEQREKLLHNLRTWMA